MGCPCTLATGPLTGIQQPGLDFLHVSRKHQLRPQDLLATPLLGLSVGMGALTAAPYLNASALENRL